MYILLFFLILVTYLDRTCIGLASVSIKSEFKLTDTQWGWVGSFFALAYALFEIPSGVLGDRIGQRKVLLRIVLWWSLFTALTGLTTGFVSLIIVRFLFGMGEAGAFPNSAGVISHWFPAKETARGLSALYIGSNAGAALAPLIVIPVMIAFGWRATFFVNTFLGVLWALVCFVWFRNNPSEMRKITEDEKHYIEKNRRVKTHQLRFPWKRAFANSSFRALMTSFFCSQWGLYFFLFWLPAYLLEGRHFSESDEKWVVSSVFIAGIFGSVISGWLSDWLVKRKGLRFGRRVIGATALGALAISFFVEAITTSNTVVVIALLIGYLIFSSNGLVATSVCIDIGCERAGTAAAIVNFFGQMGSFFLGIVFGKLVDYAHNFNLALYLLVFVLSIGSLSWLAVDPTQQLISEEELSPTLIDVYEYENKRLE